MGVVLGFEKIIRHLNIMMRRLTFKHHHHYKMKVAGFERKFKLWQFYHFV